MALKISVTLETNGNAAFADDMAEEEVARILRNAARRLEDRTYPEGGFTLYDVNGNRCGQVVVEETSDD